MDLVLYFFLSLFFSTLFSMGGVGSAIALVSIFPLVGMPLNMAKAVGLFINTASTVSASLMNLYRGVLDMRSAMPLVVSILVATPLGAYSSQFVPEHLVKWVLVAFLLLAATLLLQHKHEARFALAHTWILYVIGAGVGLISGLLGVGGGTLIMPLLILLGFDAKKAAYAVSFVIPFSSLGGFFTYLQFVKMDWVLLSVVTVAALLGGVIGNRIMHYRLSQAQIRKLIAMVLLLLALKIIRAQF